MIIINLPTHLEKVHFKKCEGIYDSNSIENNHDVNYVENIKEELCTNESEDENDNLKSNADADDPLVMDEIEKPQSPPE